MIDSRVLEPTEKGRRTLRLFASPMESEVDYHSCTVDECMAGDLSLRCHGARHAIVLSGTLFFRENLFHRTVLDDFHS